MSYGEDFDYEVDAQSRRALRLREPTGRVTYPFVLFEGEEKAGKTYAACALSASPKVGHTFAMDLGEGTLDEYAPLGPYKIIDHNGTYYDMLDQLELALAEPSDPEKPNVIIIDPITNLWKLIVRWLDGRARNSASNRRKLERDPDAEITITQNLWNDGKARWRKIVDQLMTYPGIVIVTARGKEVSEVDAEGNPTKNKTWSVEAEKSLTWDVTAWVRFVRGAKPKLVAVRSLGVDVPANGMELDRDGVAEHVIFNLLSAGTPFTQRDPSTPVIGVRVDRAKERVLAFLTAQNVKPEIAKQQAALAWRQAGLAEKREVTEGEIMLAIEALRGMNIDQPEPEERPTLVIAPYGAPPLDVATPDEQAESDAQAEADSALDQEPPVVTTLAEAIEVDEDGHALGVAQCAAQCEEPLGTTVVRVGELVFHPECAPNGDLPECTAGDGPIEPAEYVEHDGKAYHMVCAPML